MWSIVKFVDALSFLLLPPRTLFRVLPMMPRSLVSVVSVSVALVAMMARRMVLAGAVVSVAAAAPVALSLLFFCLAGCKLLLKILQAHC